MIPNKEKIKVVRHAHVRGFFFCMLGWEEVNIVVVVGTLQIRVFNGFYSTVQYSFESFPLYFAL